MTATIGAVFDPYGVAVNPTTNLIYVTNFGGNSVSVIDGATNAVTATIGVGSSPYEVAVNPITNLIYVTTQLNSDQPGYSVSVIDGATNTVTATIRVGSGPYGVAVNSTTNLIYVTNTGGNSVSVISGATNAVTATIGVVWAWAVAVNPITNLIYVTIQGNSVSVISPATIPGAPAGLSAAKDDAEVTVSWAPPASNGGSAITSYTVTSSPETKTCTWTSGPLSCTVIGLTMGQEYTFTAVATNAMGSSPSSEPSNKVVIEPVVRSLQSHISGISSSLSWISDPPDDKATIQKSSDGINWTTLGTSTTQNFTISGAGLSFYVRVLSSSGASSNVIGITTGGLAQQSIEIVSSDGTPVSGGSVTWKMASGSARSSIAYGLLSDGTYTFPAAPGGPVDITLQNAQMPDGAYVSGTFRGVLSADRTFVVRLPAEPSAASHQVQVLTPNGLPVWNAFVSVTNLASKVTVDGATFTIPSSVDPCSSSYNSSGCDLGPLPTDVNGSISYWGYYGSDYDSSYYSSPTQIDVSYDDGVVTQTPAVIVPTTANVTINLDYEPVVAPVTAVVVATAPGALTPITITLNGGIGANFRGRTAHAVQYLSGKRVTALPPVGYKACAGQVLQGVSNAQGKVTFKICSTQQGQVRFKTPGVLIPGAVSLYVRGAPSTPVLQLKATSPSRGAANLTWAAPTYTGGQPVTSYQVTLSAPGKKSVTASVKTLSVALSGLSNATWYSVTVVPITRRGAGRAAGAVISVA